MVDSGSGAGVTARGSRRNYPPNHPYGPPTSGHFHQSRDVATYARSLTARHRSHHNSLSPVLAAALACLPGPSEDKPSLGCETPAWRMVFQNDAEGGDLGGVRAHLVAALRRGSPIRVAWGTREPDDRSVVEFAEPVFTSLMNDRDVVVQFEQALIQTDYLDPKLAALREPPLVWRGLMSTDGRFDAVMTDAATGQVRRRLRQRAVMTWYALGPAPECDSRPTPVLAVPNAIRIDSTPPR